MKNTQYYFKNINFEIQKHIQSFMQGIDFSSFVFAIVLPIFCYVSDWLQTN